MATRVRAAALEIAITGVQGARAARDGGADRVELCSALELGGLTPSLGLVDAVAAVGIDLHVLVRPRPGGFVFTATEVEVMVRDLEHLVDAGVAGVVIGALTPDRGIDRHAVKSLVRAAEGREVTFHRALDVVADARRALAELADLGVRRVLTSGGATRAVDGLDVLAALTQTAAGRIEVMAGGSVDPEHIPLLLEAGVDAVHLSARVHRDDAGAAGPGGGAAVYSIADPEMIAHAAAALT
ncbi:copper homeostasis protein CutC [Occultella kanbiaonis]|uniref:copper homeostasis protein CutC n=1 Tax=Occultella kanbiaonis TaxID=2675754 RepID=UPI0012B82466|nr:copper homeostasis protein CutC [Occultella kanbiaonis]